MRDWVEDVRHRLSHEGTTGPASDVVEELAQHVADLHRAALRQGHPIEVADQLADAELARLAANAGTVRPPRRSTPSRRSPLPGLWRDAVFATRLLLTRRGYTTIAVLTLAVGIGACAAVFSVFDAILLRPLPYQDPDRLVLLWETNADDPAEQFIVSGPNYQDWRAATHSFAAMGVWEHVSFNVAAAADPERVPGVRTSSSLFDVLQVNPARGRVFTEVEEGPGHALAVISDAVWRTHYGADPLTVGRTMLLNGVVHEVIGIMPPGFAFPRGATGVWVPIQFTRQDAQRGSHSFYVAARLAQGTTFEQARDEIERLGAALRERYQENAGEGATIQRMSEFGLVNTRTILVALSGAVGLVLLIACVNVAGLQTAQGLARHREFAARLALGARHAHLLRQVFIEGAVVAALGCVGGLTLATAATRWADHVLSPGFRSLPFRGLVAVELDWRVLFFAIAAAAGSTLIFAFVPIAGLRRQSLQSTLREGDRGATRIASGVRRVLVAAQIALTIVVLCGAGLLVRSLTTLLKVDPGLDPEGVLTMEVSLPQPDTYGPPIRAGFCSDLSREVESVPGVMRASAVSHLPLGGANAGRGLTIEGCPAPAPGEDASASYRLICPNYFATLSIPLLAGRDFSAKDVRDGAQVVILNRAMAERYWPDGNALGQRLKLGGADSSTPWLTVVGIVENVRHFGLEWQPYREIFRPYSQAAWPVMTMVAETIGEPMTWQRPVREALRRVELNLPAANAQSMEDVIHGSLAWRETPMRLLTGFSIVALLLSGIGIYGLLAYYVSQRTREFGVRLAFGASGTAIVALVLRQSVIPLVAGVGGGVAGSLASAPLLAGLLHEVTPGDPAVLAAIVAMLVVVWFVSSWIPARRALGVDPVVALRDE